MMDITIEREALLRPLQSISSIVDKKQTLPLLSNVLLKAANGELSLTGTDIEIELIGTVTLNSMTDPGQTTVSARKLFDICRMLPEGSVLRLSLEKNHLAVRAHDSCYLLNTLPVNGFPSLEDVSYPASLTIKQSVLKDLLTKTYFAMGLQDVRHYLNGAYLEIKQGMMRCVAADGHRLAMSTYRDTSLGEVEAKMVIPRKSVLELMRLLTADVDADITIQIAENRFRALMPDFIFTSKLINAQYPDYNRLIPKGVTEAIGQREVIKQALTRASILSNEKFRGVRFQLEPSKLMITANNADQEHAEEAIALKYEGSNIEIGFNVAYLLDVVSAISGKLIKFSFSEPSSGVLIEPEDGGDHLYVVMPMRL